MSPRHAFFAPLVALASLARPAPIDAQPTRKPTAAATVAQAQTARPPAEARTEAPAADKRAEATATADLDRLRAEHSALRDALFRSRARRELLENALLSTQLIPIIRWEGSRRFQVKTAELRLDGVRIWEAGNTPLGEGAVTLASRGVPPGAHVLGVRVDVRARDNPKLGYISEQSFTLALPEAKKTTIEVTVDEGGNPPSYNPEVEVEISSK